MKWFAGILLWMLLVQSCHPLKTTDHAEGRHPLFCARYLVIKATGNMADLGEMLELIPKDGGIGNILVEDNEYFFPGTTTGTVKVRVYSPAQANQIICLMNNCRIHIVSIEEER